MRIRQCDGGVNVFHESDGTEINVTGCVKIYSLPIIPLLRGNKCVSIGPERGDEVSLRRQLLKWQQRRHFSAGNRSYFWGDKGCWE
jgi:hypothetical protein